MENIRLLIGADDVDIYDIRKFSDWILRIGDGNAGESNDSEALIEIPEDLLRRDIRNPLSSIVSATYPYLLDHLDDLNYFQERAILAPTHDVVEEVNDHIVSLIPGDLKTYLSSDSPCKEDLNSHSQSDMHFPKFLNTIKCSGLPKHELKHQIESRCACNAYEKY